MEILYTQNIYCVESTTTVHYTSSLQLITVSLETAPTRAINTVYKLERLQNQSVNKLQIANKM